MTDKLRPRLSARCSACIWRLKDWMQHMFYARFSPRGLSASTAKMSQTPVAPHGSRPARLLTRCEVTRRPARHAAINLAGLQRRQGGVYVQRMYVVGVWKRMWTDAAVMMWKSKAWRCNNDDGRELLEANGRVKAMKIRDVLQLRSTQSDEPVGSCRDMAANGLAGPTIDPSSELSAFTQTVSTRRHGPGVPSQLFISLLLPPRRCLAFLSACRIPSQRTDARWSTRCFPPLVHCPLLPRRRRSPLPVAAISPTIPDTTRQAITTPSPSPIAAISPMLRLS